MPIAWLRRRSEWTGRGALVCALLLPGIALHAGAQAISATAPVKAAPPTTAHAGEKPLTTDMDHLLELAKQLKAAVDKSRRDELSMQVIRDADEIDRLVKAAKSQIH